MQSNMNCCNTCRYQDIDCKSECYHCSNSSCPCHKSKGEKIPHSALKHCPNCVFPPNYNCSCSCHSTPATSWEEKTFEAIWTLCRGMTTPRKNEVWEVVKLAIEAAEERGRTKELEIRGFRDVEYYEKGERKARQDILEEIERELPPARTENYFEAKGMNHYRTAVLTLLASLKK